MTLVYLAVAWIGGIWLAHQLWTLGVIGCATPGWLFIAGAAGAVIAGVLLRGRPATRLPVALIALCFLAAARYQAHPLTPCLTPGDLAFYRGSEVQPVLATVEGVVVGYPDPAGTRVSYRLRAERLSIAGQTRPVQGDALVLAARFPEYGYGDRIRVTGGLMSPSSSNGFDYAAFLSTRGVGSLLQSRRIELVARGQGSPFWTALYGLRADGSALLNRVLPEPAAALANGMLLGVEGGIPKQVEEAFRETGTTHVIVISGSNIALLTVVLMGLLCILVRKSFAAVLTASVIVLYVLLVGADPSALRAGVMGVLLVFGIAVGRTSTAYVSLCFAALLMTLGNPSALWDVGFQLSFAATLGLILFTPQLKARLERILTPRLPQEQAHRMLGLLTDGLIVTLAVQVFTLPLILLRFGRLSLVGALANFLILPAQPPIVVGGLMTLFVGLLAEPLGQVAAVVPWFFLTYTTTIVESLAALPFASVATGAPGRAAAVLYLVILLAVLLAHRWRTLLPRGWTHGRTLAQRLPAPRQAATWLAVIAAPALLAAVLGLRPDGLLHVTFIPAAGGESVLVTTPGGRRAWIWDGRGDGAAHAAATRSALRGWRQGVDLAIGPEAGKLWPAARPLDPAQTPAGTIVRLGDGVELLRLPADDGWLLRAGDFSTLLPSLLRPDAQAALLKDAGTGLSITLLKMPGICSSACLTATFLDATRPQVLLRPSGVAYPPEVTAWLAGHAASLVSGNARVEVTVEGEKLWVQERAMGNR